MIRSARGRLRDGATGAVIVACALLAAAVLHQRHGGALAPNEAIAVIPVIDGIGEGTPVRIAGIGQAIGEVTSVARRGDDFVLRLRFHRDAGLDRRRGDGVRITSVRAEKSLVIVTAPSYEKPRTPSDTLYPIDRNRQQPRSVDALLAGLYRGTPRQASDTAARR